MWWFITLSFLLDKNSLIYWKLKLSGPDYKSHEIDLFGEQVLYICDIWKKILKSGPICAYFCAHFVEARVRGVRRWNFRWSTSYMRAKCPPSARSSMCTHQAQPPPPSWGTPKSALGKKGVFLVKGAVVCLVGAHTVPRSGGWKGPI